MMMDRISPRGLAVAAAVVLLAATFFVLREPDDTRTVSAHFSRAVSIYEGSDVRILGVNVGTVTAVIPAGNAVRVEMEYDAAHELPADAKAVIVTPTLVADRFVQLTPVYESGPTLADGAEIPLPDTGVPVELDRIYGSLRDLSAALGPNGANADGTLDHLLGVSAEQLRGKGAAGNRMLRNLSDAAVTFGEGSGDLFETVSNLARFSRVLAENDELVTAFIQDLAGVSADLAEERQELRAALAQVARAVGTVESFVRENRESVTTNVEKLTRVVKVMASEKESLDRALTAGPVGISNLNNAFDIRSGSIGSRIGIQGNVADADGFLCAVVQQTDMTKEMKDLACQVFKELLEPATGPIADGMAPSSDESGTGPSREAVVARYAGDGSSDLSELLGAR